MGNKVEKQFEASGFTCVVLGLTVGHRCGYVGVGEDHILYGEDDGDGYIPSLDVACAVHGGLTYSGDGANGYPIKTEAPTWWFGFDCGHSCDGKDESLMDSESLAFHLDKTRRYGRMSDGPVRSAEYVAAECRHLAEQIAALGGDTGGVERYVRDGKIGVIISPSYGAGWSSWAEAEHHEFLLMDKTLVQMALDKAPVADVEKYIRDKADGTYTGGWKEITVEWLDPDTAFEIQEYDGFESIRTTQQYVLNTGKL